VKGLPSHIPAGDKDPYTILGTGSPDPADKNYIVNLSSNEHGSFLNEQYGTWSIQQV
jgi:hypothetical protein